MPVRAGYASDDPEFFDAFSLYKKHHRISRCGALLAFVGRFQSEKCRWDRLTCKDLAAVTKTNLLARKSPTSNPHKGEFFPRRTLPHSRLREAILNEEHHFPAAASILPGVESSSERFYSARVKATFALAIVILTVAACRGPGGPMERAGRTVDDAVYDVGTGIKKAGQKVQEAAQ